jgi:hypothetical protein
MAIGFERHRPGGFRGSMRINIMERTMLDVIKIEAEIAKLIAETGKINREARWYPLFASAAIIGAAAALAKLFV